MSSAVVKKDRRLGEILSDMGQVMVAFSGGVDSSYLLKRAQQELGDQVVAVVVASELFRKEEFTHAVELAESMGVRVYKLEMKELESPEIVANNPESWYFSKQLLYSHLQKLADELGYSYVLDGMIMDDEKDFRPGLRARTEAGIRSVLQEAGLYKKEIRELSQALELPVWNKPASCSLASRIPYGTEIDVQKIYQVDQAEQFITKLGFDMVRVRYHENIARIEVEPNDIAELLKHRVLIQEKLISLGFRYVSVDLKGYRTGSMNEVLPDQAM